MDKNLAKNLTNKSFEWLTERHTFKIVFESYTEKSYLIVYTSNVLSVKIEKYLREFYLTIEKNTHNGFEINLFNLLEYLNQSNADNSKSNYYRNETDIYLCYKKQLNHLSFILFNNYDVIYDFFNNINYDLEIANFEKFWKKKHPELYPK